MNTVFSKAASADPFFSVIIPVYNKEPYIDGCMASLDAQPFRQFETVFVDDGSADRSLDMLKRIAKGRDDITVIAQSNQGPSGARNTAIGAARGRYLLFLDADDTFAADALGKLHERLSMDEPDVLLFNATVVPAGGGDAVLGKKAKTFIKNYKREHSYEGICPGIELFARMKENGEYLPNACFMALSRQYAQAAGLSFEPGILHEDNLFTFFALMHAERAGHLDEEIYQRSVVENSIMTGSTTPAHVDGYYTTFVKMTEYLVELSKEGAEARYTEAINHEIKAVLRRTRNSYRKLDEEDRAFYSKYDVKQRVYFEGLVVNFCEKAEALTEARRELKKVKETGIAAQKSGCKAGPEAAAKKQPGFFERVSRKLKRIARGL